jgi:tetratricopeptide (TPR) repeat protein
VNLLTPTPVVLGSETDDDLLEVMTPALEEAPPPRPVEMTPAAWEREVAAIDEEAEAREGAAAGALRYAAARLLEDRLGDTTAAVDHLHLALESPARATFPPVLRALRVHALEVGSIWSAVDLLDVEIEARASAGDRAALLVEKAYLLEDRLLAPLPARRALEEALQTAPHHRGALVAAQAIAERTADAAFLRSVLERRLAAARLPAERARVLCRLALLAEAETSRLGEALTLFGRSLDEDALGDAAAVARAGLRRVGARAGKDLELLRGISLEAEAVTAGPARAAWLAAAAALHRYRLGAAERAAAAIDQALGDTPDDLALLATACDDDAAAGRWPRVLQLLDHQAQLTSDPEWAAALFSLAGTVAEQHCGDDAAAAERFHRVLGTRPHSMSALHALERIAARTGDAAAQASLAVAAVGRAADPAERAALALRAAELNETALHALPEAAELARQALDAVPGYPPALHLLERLYPALERWDDLVGVIESEVQAFESGAASGAAVTDSDDADGRRLERLGLLHEERLGDPSRAMALFAEWADRGKRRAPALRALLRAAEKAGDALVAAEAALRLGTEIVTATDDERVAWRFRAATLFEERAAADGEAIRAYESVLELAPSFRPALEGLARSLYRRKSFEGLAGVLSRMAAGTKAGPQASALQLEAARVQAELLGQPEVALGSVSRALSADPASVDAADYYARLLQRLGRVEELGAALGALAERIGDPAAKAGTYRRQAEVYEWQLRRPREALLIIERSLGAGAAASGTANRAGVLSTGRLAALLVQERLFQLLGRGADVAQLQTRRLGIPQGRAVEDAAQGLNGARIDLALRLPDAEQGALLLGRVLDDAPGEVLALEMRVDILRRLGRDREAGVALERLAEVTREPEARLALWRAAIAARERTGGAAIEALPLYERLVEGDPAADALALFERLAARRGDWTRVVLARRTLAERASAAQVRAALLWELGLARAETGDLAAACADLEAALGADQTFLPALGALARLRERLGDARAAAELYRLEARASKSPERAADCFRQAARLFANAVRDDQAAASCLEDLLALDPDAEVDFQVLEVILRNRHEEARLVDVLRRRAAAGTGEKRRDRLLHLAGLLHDLGAVGDAAIALGDAVQTDPTSVVALLRLAELLVERGRPTEAVENFRRAIAASADPDTVSAAWIRVGEIAAAELGDQKLATAAYQSALLSAPDDVKALGGLVRALVGQHEHTEAAQVWRHLATVDPDRGAAVAHWVALGDLLAGPAEDPEAAAEALEEALALDPVNDAAIDRLDGILTHLDEPSRLAEALTRYLEIDPASAARRVQLAGLWSGPLVSPHRAIDELRVVLRSAPEDVAARAELARVLEEAFRPTEAVSEHLALLRIDPLRLTSIRALRRLFERTGERDRADRALGVLVALAAVDPGEARAVREARLRWSPDLRNPISSVDFDAVIRHPDEHHPATALLAAMAEVVPRLYGASIEDWGVTKADRLGARSEDPVRGTVAAVSSVLGLGDGVFEIYLARTGVTQVEIDATQPPALLLPANVAALPRQELFGHLGHKLGRLRAGTHVAARIPSKELGLVIVAGVRTVYPDYGRGALPEDRLTDMSQKIARALPRRHRRAFEQAALSFRDGGVFDSDRWRAGLAHTGQRAALLIAGDVVGAFEQIVRVDRNLAGASARGPEDLLAAARLNIEAVEMINFALGDELAALNARLAAG